MKYMLFLTLMLSSCAGEKLLVAEPKIQSIWNGRYQELINTGIIIMEVGTKQIRISSIEGIVQPNVYNLETIISQDPHLKIWLKTDDHRFIPVQLSRDNIRDNHTTISISQPKTQIEEFPQKFETNISSLRTA